jgi:hypothetical protein
MAIRSLIARSDAVLALIADEPSSWVLDEISDAQKQQIPVVPMLLGKNAAFPNTIANTKALRIENSEAALRPPA